jgi:cyanophycinase
MCSSLLPVCVAASVMAATTVGCAPPQTKQPGAGRDDEEVPVEADTGPCPAAGPGLTLEETGPVIAGDQGDGVVVLMGGGAEVDRGSARFIDGARGGDVLVLRASGSTSSYTSYFADDLSALVTVPPRSVGTIRIDDPAAGADDAVLCRLRRADAVWLAGGDQSDYLVQWPTALHDGLRDAVARGAAIGGTSAGAMSWSSQVFDAIGGSVSSEEALQSPLASVVSVSTSPFAAVADSLVDTHFQARDREGRLLAFLARAASGTVGIGIDEGTALVVNGHDAAVLADDGGAVWMYQVGGVTLNANGPLSIDAVARLPLADGARASWPVPFVDAEGLSVVDGVIVSKP